MTARPPEAANAATANSTVPKPAIDPPGPSRSRPVYWTTREVADLLRCSTRTVHRRSLEDPDFPMPMKSGNQSLWNRDKILAYCEVREVG